MNTLNAKGHRYKKWCGPTALAIITGRTLRYCHNKLAKIARKEPRYLKGVWNCDMHTAFLDMGYELHKLEPSKGSLAAWAEDIATSKKLSGYILVNVTNHYIVLKQGKVLDNRYPDWLPARAHQCALKRIQAAWLVKRRTL